MNHHARRQLDVARTLAERLDIVESRYPPLDTAYPRHGLEQTPQRYESV